MNHWSLILIIGAFAGAGCGSLSDATNNVREKFGTRDAAMVRNFEADSRRTYEAVRSAATNMGYRFIRGGAAQGEFEAISGIARGETHGSARQISMKVTLRPTLDEKGTDVAVRLTEIIEADSSNRAGQATETPLRDTPQYDVFFRRVGQALGLVPPGGN